MHDGAVDFLVIVILFSKYIFANKSSDPVCISLFCCSSVVEFLVLMNQF